MIHHNQITIQDKITRIAIYLALVGVLFGPTLRGRSSVWGTRAHFFERRCWPRTRAKRYCNLVSTRSSGAFWRMGRRSGTLWHPRIPQALWRHNMTNVWHLFEYVAYVFATKKLRSATVERRLSAIKFSHRISQGFELDTTHPV